MNNSEAQIENLLDRPIAFHRVYVSFGLGITGALMLSQAMYWSTRTKNPEGWFYKTQKEWEDETGMSRAELETARKRLIDSGFLKIKKAGIPCKTFYMVLKQALRTRLFDSCKQVCGNPANCNAGMSQTITENTTENTTENNICPKSTKPPAVEKLACDFDKFWNAYGHKVSRGQAERAFKRAITLVPLEDMLKAIAKQKNTDKWQNGYQPNASTWLNGKEWENDIKAMMDKRKEPFERTKSFVSKGMKLEDV